jgi:TM2 domain-containing membrane protein YozV
MSSVISCPHCGGAMDNAEMFIGLVACPFCAQQFTILPPDRPNNLPPSSLALPRQQPYPGSPVTSSPLQHHPYSGLHALSSALPATLIMQNQSSTPVYVPDKKSAGVAAVLSFFYIGLGQIYNGEIFKGLLFMLIPPAGVFIWIFLGTALTIAARNVVPALAAVALVVLTYIGLWIWSMVDAHSTAEWINHRHRREHGGGRQ